MGPRPDLVADLLSGSLTGRSPNCDWKRGRQQPRPLVSAVIPALNEEPNLPFVLPKIAPWVDEVILVDGRSTDRTLEMARALYPGIRIVHQSDRGKGAALRAGFRAATGDIIVMLDADGSTDPSEMAAFVGALVAGADFVKGTRFAQGAGTADMSSLRRIGNKCFVLLVRLLFGGRCSDLCYGYMAFWKRVLPSLDLDSNGFEIETQLSVQALRAGLKIVEVSSYEHRRIHGKSNLRTLPDGWRVLKTILHERVKRSRVSVAEGGHVREGVPSAFDQALVPPLPRPTTERSHLRDAERPPSTPFGCGPRRRSDRTDRHARRSRMSNPLHKGTINIHDSTPEPKPPLRLLHDLDAVGRMQRNTRAPAAERLRVALGDSILEIARRSLVEPEESGASPRVGRNPAA